MIIFDLMFFYVDGIEVLRKIREKSNLLIIIFFVKDEEVDRIVGFSMGVDDYIMKLFLVRELVVRIKVNLRRYVDYNNIKFKNIILNYRDLKMDILNYKVLK